MLNTVPLRLVVTALLRMVLAFALLAGLLFSVAGRWDLPMFWAYLIVFFGIGLIGLGVVWRRDPSLLKERFSPPAGGRDRLTRKAALVLLTAFMVVAALDAGRFHLSGEVPMPVQVAGLAGVAGGLIGWMWAMAANRFFSSAVRIQRDRGHYVITSGPYRFVRHPGYLAGIVLFLASPLALGSYVSVLPMLVIVLVFLRRTALEDRMLREELEGYASYAGKVRYRLVPGVW